jgi:predicted dehydrogenase
MPSALPRYVLIGCAARVAEAHLSALAELPVRLVGASDIDAERGPLRAEAIGCPFFVDHRAMLAALCPDVAIVATPPPHHAPIAIDCLQAGAHVLVEKPLADDVGEGDRAIAAARAARRLLGVNFPQRFRPAVEYARALVMRGELGRIMRVLSVDPWLRGAAYYRSAPWRATWKGEGGGVLLNQAPHAFDVLCHLIGSPARVWGMTRTRLHAVEAEDSAQAMLEYDGGAMGFVVASTVEAGTDKMLEILGDRAVLKITGDQVDVRRFERPLCDHVASADRPPIEQHEVRVLAPTTRGFLAVHRDFLAALSEGRPPRCDGAEALMSLELANAIILSSIQEKPVSLPLDRAAYASLLAQLRSSA